MCEQCNLSNRFLSAYRVDGKTLSDLAPYEAYTIANENAHKPSKGGAQIYVHSFGAVPILFCAPRATCLYTGDGEYQLSEDWVARFAGELAQACGAMVVFPVCAINHPSFIDADEDENPLVSALNHIFNAAHIALYIEVHGAYLVRGHVYFDTNNGVWTLGWPSLSERLTRLFPRIEKSPEQNRPWLEKAEKALFCTMVRKQFHTPALSLIYNTNISNAYFHWPDRKILEEWLSILNEAAYHLPRLAAYCQGVKQQTGVAKLERMYRAVFADRDTQPLLPVVSSAPLLPPESENGVVEAATTLELLDGLYARFGGGQ